MSSVETTAILAPNHEMVLQVATDRQVHAFDLTETFRVSVGRHPSNDIQLRSRKVSTYHAEILSEVEGLFVRDMGSTNGTYVNDQSVRRKKLSSGDCIRIGGFTLSVRLVPRSVEARKSGSASAESFPLGSVGNLLPFQGPRSSPEGGRERPDTTLAELVNEISHRKGTALITIRTQQEEGRIYLREGAVVHCEHGIVRREKALFRLLALERGTYEVHELPATAPVPQTIDRSTDDLVVEGMQQIEALDKLSARLPSMVYEMTLNEACGVPVSTLTADELEIYQQLIRHQTVARVLDESEMTDFMVLLLSHALLQKGFFRPTKRAAPLLEKTVINPQGA